MNSQMSPDSLFELRLAWIKSISRIWAAKEENPDDFLDKDTFSNALVKQNYNDYGTVYGAMDILKEYRLFNNPWNIELHIKQTEDAPYWNPGVGEYEVANPHKIEQVLLYIPNAPDANRTQAAADYYACAPSIFGGFETPDTPLQSLNLNATGDGSDSGSRFDVGNDTGPLYEFGAVLMDAVSLTWINESFKKELITQTPINATTGNIEVDKIGKAQKVLKENFGYEFPWNFDLVIAVDDDANYGPNSDGSGTGYKWSTTKLSRLVLVVPEPPTTLQEYGPIALASYNAGGSKYPFSCG